MSKILFNAMVLALSNDLDPFRYRPRYVTWWIDRSERVWGQEGSMEENLCNYVARLEIMMVGGNE